MRKIIAGCAALTLLAFAAVPASAQRSGFYLGLGIAYGSYDLSGITLESTYKSNIGYYGEAGLRLSSALALGVEADYYTKSSSGASISVWYYNAALAFYPGGKDLWLKLLAGYANTSANQGLGSQGGYDMGIGLGYDWHLGGGGLTIVPFVQYVAQRASAKFPSTSTAVKSQLFLVGGAIALNH